MTDLAVASDGRRQRSARNRALIVEAMMTLIAAGEMRPNAAQVAAAAGVGLRTVFRHFEDMDSLFSEMSARVSERVMPRVLAPYTATGWRERLDELITRRARVFEEIFPFRVAANLRRFQSAFLMARYEQFLKLERAGLAEVLPDSVTRDAGLFAALELATGFQAWRRLRQDQGLGAAEAEAVIRLMVLRLVPA